MADAYLLLRAAIELKQLYVAEPNTSSAMADSEGI